ncbi:hypothetical protein [Flavobacterium cerinum]|uniref:Peptidase S74 domain-containing protein n=1 Tax=Flavobacterium cerinum TaxID=2502784 RepID=A0ABY5IRC2_9FLAO|nr:hypothetical protein [Flavobacterium cerinum]UUC43924.1 hypothetical protein NOX80_09785 [Flavobacterium cerinum]
MKKTLFQVLFILAPVLLFCLKCNAQNRRPNLVPPPYNATYNGARDDFTNSPSWSWTVDDDDNSNDVGAGFKWWNNGGNQFSDLLMQLILLQSGLSLEIPSPNNNVYLSLMANDSRTYAEESKVYPYIFLQTGDARTSIFFGKDHYLNFSLNPKAPTNHSTFSYADGFRFIDSGGADITNRPNSYGNELMRITKEGLVGIGTTAPESRLHVKGVFRVESTSNHENGDVFTINTSNTKTLLSSTGDDDGIFLESKTGNKITIGDGNDSVFINSNKIICDYGTINDDDVKMSINTRKHVEHATLTVAGATYIGPKAELAAEGILAKFNPSYLDRYSLWVEKGIVSEDFAFANVATWKDTVFNTNYDLMPLEELRAYIYQNKHLPNVPSEKSIKENGYTAHQMNMIFIQKIEELTLYTLSLNEKIKNLEEELTCKKDN